MSKGFREDEVEGLARGYTDKAPPMKREKGTGVTTHTFNAPMCLARRTRKFITRCIHEPLHEGNHRDKFGIEW